LNENARKENTMAEQSGRIRVEYGAGDRGAGNGPGDTGKLPKSGGMGMNDGPGTLRNPPRAPSPDMGGAANRPSTGKLHI